MRFSNSESMGPRESIASEILDTIRFGAIDKIVGANSYRKREFASGGDAYVIPFGHSKSFYGAVVVRAPKNIEIHYQLEGKANKKRFYSAYETKRFLVRSFINRF